MKIAAFLLVCIVALGGCAALDEQAFPGVTANTESPTQKAAQRIPEGRGRVWIYRLAPKRPGLPPVASVDGGYNFYLVPHPSVYVDLLPGRHEVKEDGGNRITFDLRAGEEVFVRFDLDPALFGKGFQPVVVDLSTGRREYKAHSGVDTEVLVDP